MALLMVTTGVAPKRRNILMLSGDEIRRCFVAA